MPPVNPGGSTGTSSDRVGFTARRSAGTSAPPGTPGSNDPFTFAHSVGSTGSGVFNSGAFAQGGAGASDPAFQRDISSFFGGITFDDVLNTVGKTAMVANEVAGAFGSTRSSRDIFALEGPEAIQTSAGQDASGRLGVASGPPGDQSSASVQLPFIGPVDITKLALIAGGGFLLFAVAKRVF